MGNTYGEWFDDTGFGHTGDGVLVYQFYMPVMRMFTRDAINAIRRAGIAKAGNGPVTVNIYKSRTRIRVGAIRNGRPLSVKHDILVTACDLDLRGAYAHPDLGNRTMTKEMRGLDGRVGQLIR